MVNKNILERAIHYTTRGGGGYSLKFQIGVWQPGSKSLTLLKEETNEN